MSKAASTRNTCCPAPPTFAASMSTIQRTRARCGSAATTAHQSSKSNRSTRPNLFRERLAGVRFRAPEVDAFGSIHGAFPDNLCHHEVGDQLDLARLQRGGRIGHAGGVGFQVGLLLAVA